MADEEDPITALDVLDAQKVSGVGTPANGTPWLAIKGLAEEEVEKNTRAVGEMTTEEPKGEPHDKDTDSPEADAAQETMSGDGANEILKGLDPVTKEEVIFCGDKECTVCKAVFSKAKLKTSQRNALPDSTFAGPDRSYPIPDKSHARNALSRVSQFGDSKLKSQVRNKVKNKFGIGKKEMDALMKSPGVPDFSVAVPKEHGHVSDTGTSGARIAPMATNPSELAPADHHTGGKSPYEIGVEGDMSRGIAKDGVYAVTTLVEALARIADGRSKANVNPESPEWKALDPAAQKEAAVDLLVSQLLEKSHHTESEEEDDPADDNAEKAGRRHSADTIASLEAARAHLNKLLGAGEEAGHTGRPHHGSEEDQIMTTLTKEEITESIATATVTAVKAAMKAERKAAKAKAEEAAAKNANNKGDVTEDELKSRVKSEHPANDVEAVKDAKKAAKKDKALKSVAAGVTGLDALLKQVQEQVTRIGQGVRKGGPVLDGQQRGNFPAAEGRTQDTTAIKEGESDEIQKLAKQLETTLEKNGPDNAARASELSQQLTLARLRAAHEAGVI